MAFVVSKIQNKADIIYLPETTSTNDVAAKLGKESAPHLTTVIADKQTAGRGRLGRLWYTFPECALAFSIIIRQETTILPLLVSVAIHKALAAFTPTGSLAIKWPNDIIAGTKKVAGVLIESYIANPQNTKRFYIVGIGINVNQPSEPLPPEINATTLETIASKKLEREAILQEILIELDKNLDHCLQKGDGAVLDYYQAHCMTLGCNVTWLDGEKPIVGKAISLTEEGNLLLETDQGLVTCSTGDIIPQQEVY